jgi:hypothetical protein
MMSFKDSVYIHGLWQTLVWAFYDHIVLWDRCDCGRLHWKKDLIYWGPLGDNTKCPDCK